MKNKTRAKMLGTGTARKAANTIIKRKQKISKRLDEIMGKTKRKTKK